MHEYCENLVRFFFFFIKIISSSNVGVLAAKSSYDFIWILIVDGRVGLKACCRNAHFGHIWQFCHGGLI